MLNVVCLLYWLYKCNYGYKIMRKIFGYFNLMSKRGRSTNARGGSKKVKEEIDYSLWEDIGNQLRIDAMRAVRVTKSGHPTSSSSISDILSVLFFHEKGLKFHPKNPKHFLNDRIVLSKGHAAPALYAAFYRAGIFTEEQLLSLRLKDSIVEGHPVPKIPFVDVATGSLGQGLSVAAGMAYSSKYFDKINNRVFCITGDGELAQGSIWQAASFSSFYKLNNLVVFADINRLGQSQQTMYAHDISVYEARFNAFGFNTISIDGHSIRQIVEALQSAYDPKNTKPTAIVCKTLKGKNFTQKVENNLDWHGKDLGAQYEASLAKLQGLIKRQVIQFKTYAPEGDEPIAQQSKVSVRPEYKQTDKISTRKAYGNGLLKARQSCDRVVGLDGDVKNSTFAITLFDKHPESFIECFIAEQNMVGVATGVACRNKIAFCSTFSAFFSRAADQIRIAALSGSNVKMVGSHAGVSIGQDGPSQMALEDLAFFRTLPKGIVLIPSDGVSAEKSVQLAGNYNDGPSFIRTSRPDVPILYSNNQVFQIGKLKVVKSSGHDSLVVVASSVSLYESIKAWAKLNEQNIHIRVLDIFSLKPLDVQGLRKNIQQVGGTVIVVEEHYPEGGIFDAVLSAVPTSIKRFAHLCVRKIPGSATPQEQVEIHGIDSKAIISKVKELVA